MADLIINLKENKKVYFASDFHLGLTAFTRDQEILRENKILNWLENIRSDAQAVFLVGDIFDFWFEYKHVVPKGFVKFFGKIASMVDQGITIYFFTGNHDLWMREYLSLELGVTIFHKPIELQINESQFFVGHGDGLGPGDSLYKILKKIFKGGLPKWSFKWLHPDLGMAFGKRWSKSSRLGKKESDENFLGDKEFLIQFSKEQENKKHRDYYIFGHRHLPLEIDINGTAKYFNLGEWVKSCTYGEYDGKSFQLKEFQPIP